MTVLVEDLLSLARLDEGRGIDITQQVKLTSVVNDAADDLHALDRIVASPAARWYCRRDRI